MKTGGASNTTLGGPLTTTRGGGGTLMLTFTYAEAEAASAMATAKLINIVFRIKASFCLNCRYILYSKFGA